MQDYLIRTTKVNFHLGDSIYNYTLFIEPDGLFYFDEGFKDREPMHRITMNGKKRNASGIIYKEVYTSQSDSILTIESLCPQFITGDSSFINEYPFDYQLIPLIHELSNSFLLNKFDEPGLYKTGSKRALRIIVPASGIKHPGRYSIYRIEFDNEKTVLNYKEGEFDSTGSFKILNSDTCIVNEANRSKVEKAISNIHFEDEYYFLKANHDPKFFIEYRIENEYYALQRPSDRGDYVKIYLALYDIQLKNARKKGR